MRRPGVGPGRRLGGFRAGNGGGLLLAPSNTTAPVASGTRGVGLTLSCTDGIWSGVPAPTYTYQWQSGVTIGGGGSFTNIGGATAATFVETAATASYDIRRVTTGANAVGSASANSNTLAAQTPATIRGANKTGWFDEGSSTMTGASWVDRDAIGNLTGGGGAANPSAGTAINGHATLSWDGGDIQTGSAISNRIAAAAFGVWAVIRTGASPATESAPMTDPGLVCDDFQEWNISITTTPRMSVLDSTVKSTAAGTMAASTVYSIRAYHDGTTLHFKSSGTIDKTGTAGTIDALTGTMKVGTSDTTGTVVEIAALIFMNATPTAQQILDMDAWCLNYGGVAP